MSKYIIELNEDCKIVQQMCVTEHGNAYTNGCYSCDLEELNSDYINEHYGSLQDEAYQRGLEDGKWKAEDGCDGCKYYEDTSLTNPCSECSRGCVDHYKPASDPDRIEVGDEVDWDGDKYVVTYLNYSFETSEIADYDLLAYDGSVVDHVKKCTFTKTGKHYDITSILEAMRK